MTRDYALYEYGYVFDEDMLAKEYSKRHPGLSPENVDPDEICEMAETMGLEEVGEFTGESFHLDNNGGDDFRFCVEVYEASTIRYFPISPVSTLFEPAYRNKEELIACMKEHYGKWLPDDPDEIYRGMRHIVGTYYG